MWKRDSAVKPSNDQPSIQPEPKPAVVSPVEPAAPRQTTHGSQMTMVNIGKSVLIKGELNGS